MKKIFLNLFHLCLLWSPLSHYAQTTDRIDSDQVRIARAYIHEHLNELGLSPGDTTAMSINDMYTDKSSGITRIYFLQRYKGVPVHNAILNINIDKTGDVFFAGNRFVSGLDEKVETSAPKISPDEAVRSLIVRLDLPTHDIRTKPGKTEAKYVFDKGMIAREDITAQLTYQVQEEKVLLAWDILLAPVGSTDKWSTRVDAITGEILDEHNWTIYCLPHEIPVGESTNVCEELHDMTQLSKPVSSLPHYNVWPYPTASPNHGPRELVIAPVDTIASPYGWHDTNGYPGAEYTITRGNNVHAFQDRQGTSQSSNDEPDGGTNLLFDFPFDPSNEPEEYVDAAVVNLFYWINFMHDYAYHFGFDEAAGNFQQNNYGKGGLGTDQIKAMTQQGANTGNENNAYYIHANDGAISSIRMYEFRGTKNFLTVNAPAEISGRFKTSFPSAGWGAGAYVTDVPVSGEVILVDDGIENPYTTDACEQIINASALYGKIALIQRGGCEFGWKALQAQNAGAIAVICISIDDDNYTMNPGNYGAGIHIPILMVGLSDGQNISQFAGNGLHVTFVDPGQELPVALDSDLDNSIIIHEYAHGISTRLVGGPSISCMGNVEQMGEGWSDFIALAVTARAGDTGEMRKGFGTYAIRDAPTGRGFRRYPYSTDMNIMPLTYGDIAPSQEIHNLGEVWAAMLWDMYWAFVEKYGWSPDPFETSSGNYKAIRLVFDGLKNTPCNPGFVDGRNAILAAAESLYGGDDICMIWEVFARRGLGYSADQGSPFDAGDQREAFDLPPVCSGNLILEKSVTDFIQPGHEIHVTITAGNYKTDTVTNVLISDEIPEGTNFKVNSSNLPASLQGNRVHFQIGDMVFNNETVITYTLETDPEAWSKRKFLDGIDEENNANWLTYTMGVDASNDWIITENHPAHSGRFTWMSSEVPEQARQALELDPDAYRIHVDGSHPVLRFYHRYKTKAGTNGGIVEVKDVNEENWQQVGDAILRNGYEGKIDYLTFVAPNMEAFSGNSGDDFEATYVDLSNWAGKDIHVRFRFGTGTDTHSGLGWLIDDIEYMDMLSYNSEVCLTTDQGDFECAIAPEGGTIVESREDPTSVAHELNILDAFIYPNPASEYFIVSISGSEQHQGHLSLLSIDGKRIQTQSFSLDRQGSIMVSTENVLPGIYLVDVSTSEGVYKAKIIIQ